MGGGFGALRERQGREQKSQHGCSYLMLQKWPRKSSQENTSLLPGPGLRGFPRRAISKAPERPS
jgi:hypothetical protein